MRFSIIIPVYNAEKYLENCLNSVLKQDYRDYEIILINDGSRDQSGDICAEYEVRYGNVRYVYQNNAGPSSARNKGIALAEGEYLIFLDSDDELENGYLKELDNIVLLNHADAIISGEKVRSSEDSQPEAEPLLLNAQKINSDKAEALAELSEKRFSLLTHKIVVKRRIVIENNLFFNTNYRVGEDILMMAQTLCKCNSFFLNETPYYIYNYNASSIMRTIRFERIWQTTSICNDLYQFAQSAADAEKKLLFTTISMLLIGFMKYYSVFTSEQKRKTRIWMRDNQYILDLAVDTHPATKLAKKFIGTKNAFLLAGFVVSRTKT